MPTVLVEFGLMEDLCSLNLSQTRLFVLPTYCGLEVQCADPFLQVIQYITFDDVQVILDKMGKISLVVEEIIELTNLGEFLQREQFLSQCLKPSFFLSDLRLAVLFGNLARTKYSLRFFGRVQQTMGGLGNTLFKRRFLVMTFQNRYKILDTCGKRGSYGKDKTTRLTIGFCSTFLELHFYLYS